MAPVENLHIRQPETSCHFNEDSSYTQIGASLEISKHIIQVPNHANSLVAIAAAKNMNIVPRFPEMAPGIAFLSSQNIRIHEKPAKHGNDSHAEYVVDWYRYKSDDGRENIIWFSRIPPKRGTSKPAHTHGIGLNGKGIYEHYIKVAGVAYIGEGENRRLMEKYEVVPPNTEHYVEAGEEGAIFFILIENVEGIEDQDIHQYMKAA